MSMKCVVPSCQSEKCFSVLPSGSEAVRETRPPRPWGKKNADITDCSAKILTNNSSVHSRQLKEFLSIPNNMTVEFTPHGESAAKSAQKFNI